MLSHQIKNLMLKVGINLPVSIASDVSRQHLGKVILFLLMINIMFFSSASK